jgi:hypothetical protein
MLHEVYAIRDSKAEMFHPPFLQKAKGEAERTFKQLANDPQTSVGSFPEDYDLYYVGKFDDNSGLYSLLDSPKHQLKAINVLTPKN